jgi:3-phenylpropionate/trans-cinnamate dioxygenase ferredoxin reductase subunit
MNTIHTHEPGIVIIGAGEAGLRAALTLCNRGYEGTVTVVGEEPHPPYERPPLSKALLHPDAGAPPAISGAGDLEIKGVRLLTGVQAVRVDRTRQSVALSDGRSLPYTRLLIATGAQARPLAVEGGHLARILRRLDDAINLRADLARCKTLLVIGGGFIGLELAAAARMRGLNVRVAEAAPRILGRATPAAIAALVADWHTKAGVEILTEKSLIRLSTRGHAFEAEFADGDGLVAELVVAGVGALPETRLAEAAGLVIDNGIAVDVQLQTSDPLIYAVGDCASFPHPLFEGRRLRLEAWRNAQDHGSFVAGSILGCKDVYDAIPWFWSDQYESTLQVAGLPSSGVQQVERRPGSGSLLTFHLDASGRLVGASGAGPLALVAKDIKIAERMISQRTSPEPEVLADPKASLKAVLTEKLSRAATAREG